MMEGRIRDISLLDGSEMVKNHFAKDSPLLVHLDQNIVEATRGCLNIFFISSGGSG